MYKAEQPAPENTAEGVRTWETELNKIFYNDPRLQNFTRYFKEFYDEESAKHDPVMKDAMDRVLDTTFRVYKDENIAREILRFYVFSTVLLQKNEGLDKYGNAKTHRREDKDRDGNPLPASIHPTVMLLEAMNLDGRGVDAETAMAVTGHDLREDATMTVVYNNGTRNHHATLEGKNILTLIKKEFYHGEEVADAIEAVTKYDKIPDHIEKMIKNSLMYKSLEALIRERNPSIAENKLHEDIMKSISSVFKLRQYPLEKFKKTITRKKQEGGGKISETEYKQELKKYRKAVMRNFAIKSFDVKNNIPTGVSPASYLRAHLIAVFDRLMGWDEMSSDIMALMATHKKDPLYQGDRMNKLAQQFTPEFRKQINAEFKQIMHDVFGVDADVHVGVRIRFNEEESQSDTSINKTTTALQAIIRVPSEHIDRILQSVDELSTNENFLNILQTKNSVFFERFQGILEKMTRIWGRKGAMFRVKDALSQTDDPLYFIRIMENKTNVYENILQDHNEDDEAPEEKLITPFRKYKALLNAQAIYFDPGSLSRLKSHPNSFDLYAYVTEEGFTTFEHFVTAQMANAQFGKPLKNPALVQLLSEKPVTPDTPPSNPFLYLREAQ